MDVGLGGLRVCSLRRAILSRVSGNDSRSDVSTTKTQRKTKKYLLTNSEVGLNVQGGRARRCRLSVRLTGHVLQNVGYGVELLWGGRSTGRPDVCVSGGLPPVVEKTGQVVRIQVVTVVTDVVWNKQRREQNCSWY